MLPVWNQEPENSAPVISDESPITSCWLWVSFSRQRPDPEPLGMANYQHVSGHSDPQRPPWLESTFQEQSTAAHLTTDHLMRQQLAGKEMAGPRYCKVVPFARPRLPGASLFQVYGGSQDLYRSWWRAASLLTSSDIRFMARILRDLLDRLSPKLLFVHVLLNFPRMEKYDGYIILKSPRSRYLLSELKFLE